MAENILAGDFVTRTVVGPGGGLHRVPAAGRAGARRCSSFASGIYPMIAGSVLMCAIALTASAIVFLRSGLLRVHRRAVLLVATLFVTFVRDPLRDREAARLPRAEAARERTPGDDRSDGVGGRDARPRDRRPHQAHADTTCGPSREELRRSGHYTRDPDARVHRAAVHLGAAARHRQGRRARPHPAQAGPADARRDDADEAARRVRAQDHLQHGRAHRRRQLPDDRRRDRGDAPREVGRHAATRRAWPGRTCRCPAASWRSPTSTTR